MHPFPRLNLAPLASLALLPALLAGVPAGAATVTGPSGVSWTSYATEAAAQSACGAGAAGVGWLSGTGASAVYVRSSDPQAGKGTGAWGCLSQLILAGYKPASCPPPDSIVWVDPNAKKYFDDASNGYGKGVGGYACRTFAIALGYQLGVAAGDFSAFTRPDAVTGCNPPNVVWWLSLDNKDAVSLTDPAAGKGKGAYACSDQAISHGYKFLLDANTPVAANCKPPDVAVWFNRNENNYFRAGSDGYKDKVGSGAFVCLKDALALGAKDVSQGIVGFFSADKLSCTPSLNVPVYVPHGSLTFLTLHDPDAPKGTIADGVGLWMCSSYASQHGRSLAKAWSSEGAAKCPGDVVVSVILGMYNEKGHSSYGAPGSFFTCEVVAKDLGYEHNTATIATGPTLAEIQEGCKKNGDQLVEELPRLRIAAPWDDPSLGWYGLALKDLVGGTGTAYVCGATAKSHNYTIAYVGFKTKDAANCSDEVFWISRQMRQYYRSSDPGFGQGSGFYECRKMALTEGLKPAVEQPKPQLPTSSAKCTNATFASKNVLELDLRNGVRCRYDLDKITIDSTSDPQNPYYGQGYAIHHDGTADFITSGAIERSYAQAFGQTITSNLNFVMGRYNYLKNQQKH